MNLQKLPARDLLSMTEKLVQTEREVLTKVLQHLREIERRRLYCDLGFSSLFDYAVKHLKYSEGQAGRRIQAMRLLKELPELEAKITSGTLNLSNIFQAQSFFREVAADKSAPKVMSRSEKLEVLANLENKSARGGQMELSKLNPEASLPKEKERVITEDKSEVRFVMDKELKEKLEAVRSLLGPKGATLSFSELLTHMAELTVGALEAKRFTKKRAAGALDASTPITTTPTPEEKDSLTQSSGNPRYLSKGLRHAVWTRDGKACVQCKGTKNLNIDHIVPIASGGSSELTNLRLLCFSCNQRAGIKAFGIAAMDSTAREGRLRDSI